MVVDTLCCWLYVCRDCGYGCVVVCNVLCSWWCTVSWLCGVGWRHVSNVWCCIRYDGTVQVKLCGVGVTWI